MFRISGDFVPLPKGHTVTWLFVDILLAFISSLVFVVIPVLLFLIWVVRRLKRAIGKSNTLAPDLHQSEIARSRIYRGSSRMIRASGFLLIVNSLVLIVRMLMDQYRSYSEIRLQLLLNIPLAAVGILSVLISLIGWKNAETKKQRSTLIAIIVFFLTLIYLLIKWQFVGLV